MPLRCNKNPVEEIKCLGLTNLILFPTTLNQIFPMVIPPRLTNPLLVPTSHLPCVAPKPVVLQMMTPRTMTVEAVEAITIQAIMVLLQLVDVHILTVVHVATVQGQGAVIMRIDF